MRIKEFSVIRYGPLSTERISLGSFNLFFGKNEDGKTLTIDAILKLLLGRSSKVFENIDRVEEVPEGYVVVEDEGKMIKIPERGSISKIFGISASSFRNIFVIRNSDLSILQEAEFYENVTDRLIGLRTENIRRIIEKLRDIGKITPKGIFRDTKDEKLKTRIENAERLIREIEDLKRDVRENGLEGIEERYVMLKEEEKILRSILEKLEDARKREMYEKGRRFLEELKRSLKEIKDLLPYNEDDKERWKDSEREKRELEKEKYCLLDELKKKEEILKEKEKEISDIRSSFFIAERRKKRIDDEIKPKLKLYELNLKELKEKELQERFFSFCFFLSALLLVISTAVSVFYSLIFLSLSLFFGIAKFLFLRKRSFLKGLFEEIKASLSFFDSYPEQISEVYSSIERFEERYESLREKLSYLEKKVRDLKDEIREIKEEKIPEIEERIKEKEEEIRKIKEKTKEDDLEGYIRKLRKKDEVEKDIAEKRSALRAFFGEKGDLKESIYFWEDEISKLEAYKEKARDISYSEEKREECERRKKKIDEMILKVEEKLKLIRKKLEDVERKANEILKDEYIFCRTVDDLKAVEDRLKGFIEENEERRRDVLSLIEIFEKIDEEEKSKVKDLFGKESPVSKYFSEITQGIYTEVMFDQKEGKVKVKRADGMILSPEKLSGGAYDQLYFSIRISLGQSLLKGKKGFFILDDPFIKADSERLKRQLKMLKSIASMGWQILYFSAKEEVKEALEDDIKKGFISFFDISGVFR